MLLLLFSLVIKRGSSPKSSASVFQNRCKDSISVWKTIPLLKIYTIAIYNNRISKFTEYKQSCLHEHRQTILTVYSDF